MTPIETLTAWRDDLIAEMASLEADLAPAREEEARAETAYREALAEWEALRDTLVRPLGPTDELAGELFGLLQQERREMLRAASGRRGTATARIKVLIETLAGRRLAVRQINRAIGGEIEKSGPVHKVAKRPKPAPVDFETIQSARAGN